MRKIGIITDSVANLDSKIVTERNIKVLPLKISIGRQTYRDGVDLTAGEFYRLLEKTEDIPSVEPPDSGEFLEIFETVRNEGYEGAVCILSSSSMTQSYSASCEARDLIRPFPVVVIDSRTSTMSQGFMVLEAVTAAEEGLAITDVVERVWKLRSMVQFYGLVGMLHYLVRCKRLGKFSAYLRALFNIKPIITINSEDGTIHSIARVKSREQGIRYFLKKIDGEMASGKKDLHVAVVHADEKEEAEKLVESISKRYKCKDIFIQELTPAIGCVTGPGVIGVNFYVD
jgi:DegV family protein with EDD domain